MTKLPIDTEKLNTIAQKYGTPCYVYSKQMFIHQWQSFDRAFGDTPHQICYAVKANSNLSILKILASLGSGFDIVSGGELARVLKAGGDPNKIIFSGVGKTDDEIIAALKANIGCFNIESEHELFQINTLAESLQKKAPIAFRINPDIPVETHPYLSTGLKENKFGVPYQNALALYREAAQLSHINIIGIDCHLGSQIMTPEPYLSAMDVILTLHDQLAKDNIKITHIDIGGGYGVDYQEDTPLLVSDFIKPLTQKLASRNLSLFIEPGRAIIARAGVLLTKVLSLKNQSEKHFAIVDAAMNDLIRPALYHAWHDIIPLQQREGEVVEYDVVGPVCETSDFLGKERKLVIQPNDILAINHCGAYGFALSSNFNTRPRVPEILIDGNHDTLIRKRETIEDLLHLEEI